MAILESPFFTTGNQIDFDILFKWIWKFLFKKINWNEAILKYILIALYKIKNFVNWTGYCTLKSTFQILSFFSNLFQITTVLTTFIIISLSDVTAWKAKIKKQKRPSEVYTVPDFTPLPRYRRKVPSSICQPLVKKWPFTTMTCWEWRNQPRCGNNFESSLLQFFF